MLNRITQVEEKHMERKIYEKPTSSVIHLSSELMETLPIGNSRDYTDSGDDSGGGLAKKGFADPNGSDNNNVEAIGKNFSAWEDE